MTTPTKTFTVVEHISFRSRAFVYPLNIWTMAKSLHILELLVLGRERGSPNWKVETGNATRWVSLWARPWGVNWLDHFRDSSGDAGCIHFWPHSTVHHWWQWRSTATSLGNWICCRMKHLFLCLGGQGDTVERCLDWLMIICDAIPSSTHCTGNGPLDNVWGWQHSRGTWNRTMSPKSLRSNLAHDITFRRCFAHRKQCCAMRSIKYWLISFCLGIS